MKIVVCGSMTFAKEMVEIKNKLEENGHEILVPIDTEACLTNPDLNMDLEHCENFSDVDLDKDHFNKISESDAILILNYPKNNIDGYIGGATLMEIGVARHLNKKIFTLFDLPSTEVLRYALEIKLAKPIILNGNLSKIV
ncbi:nucleoside 2-deoxyribosyltransferase [Patescibacteria group bacterium]|nr:nucleoside 2-deoxyribosyltransferase [Patescibacteria group bacterium]